MVCVPAGNDSIKRPRALSPVEITDDHYRQMLKRHKRRKCEEPVSGHLFLCLTVFESVHHVSSCVCTVCLLLLLVVMLVSVWRLRVKKKKDYIHTYIHTFMPEQV